VRSALCEVPEHIGSVLRETFAPILYVLRYSQLDEAIRLHNWERIRKVVRKKKKFTALFHHIDVDLLEEAFYELKANAAAGVVTDVEALRDRPRAQA
jgi:acyl-CoA reductase-like NAD-dependent aldehyde dehydrogenase